MSKTSLQPQRIVWRDVTALVPDAVFAGAIGSIVVWAASGAPTPLQWLAIGGGAIGVPMLRSWYSRWRGRRR